MYMQPPKVLIVGESNGIENHLRRRELQWKAVAGAQQIDLFELAGRRALVLISGTRPEDQTNAFLRRLREQMSRLPIIVYDTCLSQDQVIALVRAGAADVFTQSFSDGQVDRLLSHLPEAPLPSPAARWHEPAGGIVRSLLDRFAAEHAPLMGALGLSVSTDGREAGAGAVLEARLLGDFRILYHGKAVELPQGRRILPLLALLLYHHKEGISRERLIRKLWDYLPADDARNALNQAMHKLRLWCQEAFGQTLFQLQNERYRLADDIHACTDVDHFLAFCREGRQEEEREGRAAALVTYCKALAMYGGPFLSDLSDRESWLTDLRDELQESFLDLLQRQGDHFYQTGNYVMARDLYLRILKEDRIREAAHRLVMSCYHRLNHKERALRQYEICRRELKETFGTEPSRLTRELYLSIMREEV